MWGSEDWGDMVWGGGGVAIPMLSPVALAILVTFLIGTVLVARRESAPRWLALTCRGVVVLAPLLYVAGVALQRMGL